MRMRLLVEAGACWVGSTGTSREADGAGREDSGGKTGWVGRVMRLGVRVVGLRSWVGCSEDSHGSQDGSEKGEDG